jgi:glyoxalase family protein
MRLHGVHHVTAITGDAPANVEFYVGTLGLRMVKKTVNQDDPTVYHLFYADEQGSPGADLTFFEYPGLARGRAGAGMVHRILWRVGSEDALRFWQDRLLGAGADPVLAGGSLRFADPEGLEHEFVVSAVDDPPLIAEHPEVPAEVALQGFEGVRAYSRDPAGSARMLETLLGAERHEDDGRFELRGERRGGWIAFDPAPAQPGRQSAGIVHHVAWGTVDAELRAWIEAVDRAGVPNSGFVDRHYFHSLYLREPARGSGSGVRRASMRARSGSRNGGRMSRVPSSSTGPSTVKPGSAVASS